MNKTAIKNYAVWARNELIERVTRKAFEYEVTNVGELNSTLDVVNGKLLTADEKKQRQELIRVVKEKGFDQVMEEVAYTWFNRFIALRFMEVNNYLPKRVRIFTNENNEFKPQIIDEAMNLDLYGLDKTEIYELLQSNRRQELYKKLLIATCNDMGNYLPGMFTKINDYKVLLFPDNLLNDDSVLGKLISDIDEDSWIDSDIENESSNGITIIGWLYQYYISEKHNQVINILKGTVKKEDIPAATQLWTTDWVVRYMVDNSLGRYWIERNPNSSLKDKLAYLATSKNNDLLLVNERVNPEEITFLDPCMGSGHILVYAFEIFMEIYKECGYSERDAALSIIQNNLYGLDIDDRAYQLSYFAVMMKARSYNRRILAKEVSINLASIQESNSIERFTNEDITTNKELNQIGEYLVNTFKHAKELGSLIDVRVLDYQLFDEYLNELKNTVSVNLYTLDWQTYVLPQMIEMSKQAQILSKKYTICTTNPPYMGKMEENLKPFVIKNYKDYSPDLFAVFMRKNFDFTIKGGYLGFMTPFVWMFIKSYEKLREYIINNKNIATLVQMEYSAYEEATVPICSFVLKNERTDTEGYYYRLSDFKGGMEVQKEKVLEAQSNKNCGYFYEISASNFSKIPGSPIAYWISNGFVNAFANGRPLSPVAKPCAGLQTGDNGRFLRQWFEVAIKNICFDAVSTEDAYARAAHWYPYNKGGEFRKWYGNNDYVVNWENDGFEIKHFKDQNGKLRSRPQNTNYYFKECGSWSLVTSSATAFRYKPNGFIFDVAGMSFFANKHLSYYIGFCNTKIAYEILKIIAPTINFQAGDIAKLPIIFSEDRVGIIEKLVLDNISISKQDWDSFETSWDFAAHPLVKNNVSSIKEAHSLWDKECNERFNQLKANEEELNRIFIDIYGLQDELSPEVEDKDVTVRKANLTRDIKSFISYAVGCMFGRYSLDEDGLAYAGGEFNPNKYKSFAVDQDNIIPICDDEYFDDDIVGRFIKFVETVYGIETLEENLRFIADALNGKGMPKDVIRNYFLNDFYKDHCKIYQKRPIYWLFDSGKKNGFKALTYMHRYSSDLIARLRTQYVFEQQSRYRNQVEMIQNQLDSDLSSFERVRLNNNLKVLRGQDEELREYEEVVHHYADQMITIDLDDGVKVNYEKFKDLLAKIK